MYYVSSMALPRFTCSNSTLLFKCINSLHRCTIPEIPQRIIFFTLGRVPQLPDSWLQTKVGDLWLSHYMLPHAYNLYVKSYGKVLTSKCKVRVQFYDDILFHFVLLFITKINQQKDKETGCNTWNTVLIKYTSMNNTKYTSVMKNYSPT